MVTRRPLFPNIAEELMAEAASPGAAAEQRAPISAPVQLMQFTGVSQKLDEAEAEVERLRGELKANEGSRPTRLLDPNDVVQSRFANRHPDSYRDAEYLQLREEIRAAGGNTQPIGVRPLPGTPGKFELSFGSRRRMACLENGLPVLALIDEMDEVTLFERMERENRQRKNLRPYEQATLYRQALEAKLYPSIRKMAEALQLDQSGLSRLLALAALPEQVIAAFPSPLDIQYDWGSSLSDAVKRSKDAVLAKASELAASEGRRSAKAVHEALVAAGEGKQPESRPAPLQLTGKGKEKMKVVFTRDRASITVGGLAPERRAALQKALQAFLG